MKYWSISFYHCCFMGACTKTYTLPHVLSKMEYWHYVDALFSTCFEEPLYTFRGLSKTISYILAHTFSGTLVAFFKLSNTPSYCIPSLFCSLSRVTLTQCSTPDGTFQCTPLTFLVSSSSIHVMYLRHSHILSITDRDNDETLQY